MSQQHQFTKAYLNTLRRMSRQNSSGESGRYNSIQHYTDQEPVKPQSWQIRENTIKNFIDTQEHELMSTGFNMNGSRVYLASSHAHKSESPEKQRGASLRNSLIRKNSSHTRCNTQFDSAQEKDKGFYLINYRNRDRSTNVGVARKRALSSVCNNHLENKSNDKMNLTNLRLSTMNQSISQSAYIQSVKNQRNDDYLLNEVKMSGTRLFQPQTQQFRKNPLQPGEREPVWDMCDDDMVQRLKELSQPKKAPEQTYQKCIIGGNKLMSLKDPKAQEFIQRLSVSKKYIPWPTATQGDKVFKCDDSDQLEYLNKMSLPRRMADHGHKQKFRYNFCNCSNGDDYAEEGRNYQGSQSSNTYFKIHSFFYQNSKAQDDGLFYPKNFN